MHTRALVRYVLRIYLSVHVCLCVCVYVYIQRWQHTHLCRHSWLALVELDLEAPNSNSIRHESTKPSNRSVTPS